MKIWFFVKKVWRLIDQSESQNLKLLSEISDLEFEIVESDKDIGMAREKLRNLQTDYENIQTKLTKHQTKISELHDIISQLKNENEKIIIQIFQKV